MRYIRWIWRFKLTASVPESSGVQNSVPYCWCCCCCCCCCCCYEYYTEIWVLCLFLIYMFSAICQECIRPTTDVFNSQVFWDLAPRLKIPEDFGIRQHCCENFKSRNDIFFHKVPIVFWYCMYRAESSFVCVCVCVGGGWQTALFPNLEQSV